MKEAVIFYTERDFRDWFEANLDKVGLWGRTEIICLKYT